MLIRAVQKKKMCKFFELIKTIKEPYYLHNLHENIGAVDKRFNGRQNVC
jgi:hypothetical protein